MASEIERRFLTAIRNLRFLEGVEGIPIVQAYLHEDGMTSRVRIAGNEAFLTLKGKRIGKKKRVRVKANRKGKGKRTRKCRAKPEYEYKIPMEDALELIENHSVGKLIFKTRYPIPVGMHIWEVDVFHGHLQGLVIAEIELSSLKEAFATPIWAGREITGIKEYSNRALSKQKQAPLPLLKKAA